MWIMENSHDCPKCSSDTKFHIRRYYNYEDVIRFGQNMDVLTIEIENVNVEALNISKKKESWYIPTLEIIEMIKDKGLQKQYYHKK